MRCSCCRPMRFVRWPMGSGHSLRPDVRERLTVVRAISPDVYEAYLKGRYA